MPVPGQWVEDHADRTIIGNADTEENISLAQDPENVNIEGAVNYTDEAAIGAAGPRQIYSHTGALTVSFDVNYSRYHLHHKLGDFQLAIDLMQDHWNFFESCRYPGDLPDGEVGSDGPYLVLIMPGLLEIVCRLRNVSYVPLLDAHKQLLRLQIRPTFQEELLDRFSSKDVSEHGMIRPY